jgi:AraC-like DNA-binding protein
MKQGFTGERSIVLPRVAIEAEESDPLVSSLYITDIGYYPHADSHFVQRKEPISEYVLIYCVEGAGWFQTDSRRYEVGENQYFILPPNKPHAYGAHKTDPWTIYWIHFTGAHAAIYSEGATTPGRIPPAVNSRIMERNTIFEEIFATLQRNSDLESLRYASSLLHHYLATMRYLRLYRQAAPDTASLSQAVIHYMRENIEKRVTLKQMADYMGYSPSHLSMVFHKETGHSPLSYLNLMRIETACQWLTDTSQKVNQICHKVGIDDPYYFSRLFRSIKGCSPVEYRAQEKHE